jgi:pimeloyl-ACP methyl ester carboxylesterase
MITPSEQALAETQGKIDAYLEAVRSHPEQRAGAHPYYRFHPPGVPIYGTVMVFHGFSMRPHQMWRLADYLFENGFNIYQITLAGHHLINPDKNWPQIDLRPEYVAPLLAKVQQDPVLSAAMTQKTATGGVAVGQQRALLQRLLQVAPEMATYERAIVEPYHPDFERYFISSHRAFVEDAQRRLGELAAMPGPIYAVGLSVGGAVALGLTSLAGGRIERVAAYAPLLRICGDDRRRFVQLTGPLDIDETGWDPNLRFPVGVVTAADYFGSEVRSAKTVSQLKDIPTFMVLTDNEDAADVPASEQLFADLGGRAAGHWLYKYPAAAMVPHAMVDPSEVSQGMTNLFWQSMYQETLRFLQKGTVVMANLETLTQDQSFPLVQPVIAYPSA